MENFTFWELGVSDYNPTAYSTIRAKLDDATPGMYMEYTFDVICKSLKIKFR